MVLDESRWPIEEIWLAELFLFRKMSTKPYEIKQTVSGLERVERFLSYFIPLLTLSWHYKAVIEI